MFAVVYIPPVGQNQACQVIKQMQNFRYTPGVGYKCVLPSHGWVYKYPWYVHSWPRSAHACAKF